MTETEARQVLLLQAHESGAATSLWTDDDRAWATRLARQTAGAAVPFERFVVERARHALERLAPRDAVARRWLQRRGWRPLWAALVLAAAFVLGALVDHLGAPDRVDLLAPAVWAVVVWNLGVVLALLLPRPPGALRRALAGRWLEGSSDVAVLWARAAAPLALARAALLLHLAAAALAAGLVAGMYLRGLVLDYRAGWQSTFLDAGFVQVVLDTLLAPARAVTGIVLPDVAPLRLAPGAAAGASAAPWIHLYAATLALFVLLPRALLALVAAGRARALAAQLPLALAGPYFDTLRLQQQGANAVVQVVPHAVALSAQAALGLRAVLATLYGETLQLRVADAVPFGDEEHAPSPAPGTTLRVALFDLGATPEAESQGRLLAALAGPAKLLAVADEAAFRRRFAGLPERLAERRAAWQRLVDAHGGALVCADLDAPDLAAAGRALKAALTR